MRRPCCDLKEKAGVAKKLLREGNRVKLLKLFLKSLIGLILVVDQFLISYFTSRSFDTKFNVGYFILSTSQQECVKEKPQ